MIAVGFALLIDLEGRDKINTRHTHYATTYRATRETCLKAANGALLLRALAFCMHALAVCCMCVRADHVCAQQSSSSPVPTSLSIHVYSSHHLPPLALNLPIKYLSRARALCLSLQVVETLFRVQSHAAREANQGIDLPQHKPAHI